MYYFLTSENELQLPVIESSVIEEHPFDTESFLNKLRKNYWQFERYIGDPKDFEKCVDAFRWFADRMLNREAAEFFFSVRVYDAVVHPEFEEQRKLWVSAGRDLLLNEHAIRNLKFSKKAFASPASARLTHYLYSRVCQVPPGLMPFEVAYHFTAQLEREYFGNEIHDVLEKKLKEADLMETLFAGNVLEVFRQNIPVIMLMDLISAAGKHPDDHYKFCRELFFDRIKSTWSRFRDLSFEQAWSDNENIAIQILKGKFIELLKVVFRLEDPTHEALVSTIHTHLELFRLGEQNNRRFSHTYFLGALRSKFTFGTLGEKTRARLGNGVANSEFHLANDLSNQA